MLAIKNGKQRIKRWARHPWTEWLARDRLTLRRGIDYAGNSESMVIQVRARALDHGRRVVRAWAFPDRIEVELEDA